MPAVKAGSAASPDDEERAPERYRIQALDRALQVLECVAEAPDRPLHDLARRCGTSTSQTFKILATLEGRGLVAKRPDKTYRLGYGALRLGHRAAGLHPVVDAAGPTLDGLRDATGESVHLVLRDGLDAVIADVRESSQAVRVVAPVGKRGRLHVGGSGKLFLAFGPEGLMAELLRGPLEPYTELSETDPGLLRHDVGRVRRLGVCVAIGDFEDGAFSVAAPVFGAGGAMVASVAVAGPLSRFDSSLERRYRSLVKRAAEAIGGRLTGEGEGAAQGSEIGVPAAAASDAPGLADS